MPGRPGPSPRCGMPRTGCAAGSVGAGWPGCHAATAVVDCGVGAVGRAPAGPCGGRCGSAATACWKPWPLAVAVDGATIVTLRTFVMLVVLWLLFSTLPF